MSPKSPHRLAASLVLLASWLVSPAPALAQACRLPMKAYVNRPDAPKSLTEVKVRRITELKPTDVPAPLPESGVRGDQPVLLVMVETDDATFPASFTADSVRQHFFSGAHSVNAFFKENSFGKFGLHGAVVGPVKVSGSLNDYAYTRGDSSNERVEALVTQAIDQAQHLIDLKQFDHFNRKGAPTPDGVIDHLGIVYPTPNPAGGMAAGFAPIWPHRSTFTWTGESGMKADGYYIVGHVLVLGDVSVSAHEFGHDIGLPDLYDRDDSSFGIGNWCLMGSGPGSLSAWGKMKLGWITPVVITQPTLRVEIPAAEQRPFAIKIPIGKARSKEYFLIENRQRLGFDKDLPGHGLLIYHVDDAMEHNDDETHRLVDVVEASTVQDYDFCFQGKMPDEESDPWREGTMTTLTDRTNPNTRTISHQPTGIEITNISASSGVMSADISTPLIDNPGGVEVSLSYDNFSYGSFGYLFLAIGAEELVRFEATPGGYQAYELEALFSGKQGQHGGITFRLYDDVDGKPGTVLAERPATVDFAQAGYTWVRTDLGEQGITLGAQKPFWVGVERRDAGANLSYNELSTSGKSSFRRARGKAALEQSVNFSSGKEPVHDYILRVNGQGYLNVTATPPARAKLDDPLVVRMQQADAQLDKGKYAEAEEAYRKLLPEMEKNVPFYAGFIPVVINSLGVAAFYTKRYDEAIEYFNRSLKKARQTDDRLNTADLLENLGEAYFRVNKLTEAQTNCNDSLALNKGLSRPDRLIENNYWLGRIAQKNKKQTALKQYLKEVSSLATKLYADTPKEKAYWDNRVDLALKGQEPTDDEPTLEHNEELLTAEAAARMKRNSQMDTQWQGSDLGEFLKPGPNQ